MCDIMVILIGSVLSEILIILAIIVVLYIIFKLGNILAALLVNTIVGLLALFIFNSLFDLHIVYNLITIILIAIFGLPAAGIVIFLKFIGISI